MSTKLRQKKIAGGRSHLYLDIFDRGVRRKEYLSIYLTGDPKQDKHLRKIAEQLRIRKEYELVERTNRVAGGVLGDQDFLEYFEQAATKRHRSWKSALLQLRSYEPNGIRLKHVDDRWLEGLKSYLTANVNRNTASLYFAKIKACLKLAVKEGILPLDPGQYIRGVPKQYTERVFLTAEEITRLRATPCKDPEVKRAFLFACVTGLRLCDCRRLHANQIKNGVIVLQQRKTGEQIYQGLSRVARNLLADYFPPIGPIFKLPEDHSQIWKVMRHWGKAAGLEKQLSFHVSRHTFATYLLTSGEDLYTVCKLLGHTDIKHTQVYAQVIDKKRDKALDTFNALFEA